MRRLISVGSVIAALVALVVILWTATLVDRKPPTVERVALSATAGGDRVAQTLSAIDVDFSEPVDRPSVERRFHIEPYIAGAISWDGSTAIFTPSSRLPPATRFSISIAAGFTDTAGNAATAGVDGWAFTTVGPPSIVEATPTDGASGLAVDSTATIRFDRLMDTRAVEAAVRVDPDAGLRFSWSGDRLTIAFDGPLRFGTTYTLTVGGRAADTSGNPLVSPFSVRFTTVSAGLGVAMTVPVDRVPGISVRSPIAVVFDAPIDPRTVANALRITPSVAGEARVVSLPDDTGGPISPSSRRGNVLLFTPAAPLAAHTTYTVSLAPVVTRLDEPGEVAPARTWTFTTGAPATSAQNQIAFLSSRAGIRNLWVMNPDGSNPRQLTSDLAPVTAFDVSGDGAAVAYASGGAVWLMRVDGSDRRRLTADGAFEYGPRFSPDGRWILLARRSGAGADMGYWLVPVSIITGAERRVLGQGAPPLGSVALGRDGPAEARSSWSPRAAFDPTGRQALIVTSAGDAIVVELTTSGDRGTVTATPSGLVAEASPVWLAGQARFGLVAREAGRQGTSIWLVDGSGRSDLGVPALGWLDAAPDGSLVTLVQAASGASRIALVRAGTGTPPTPLLDPADTLDDRWPAFSPDGATILFSRVASRGPSLSTGIWTVSRSGSDLAQLTTDGAEARWLP